MTKKDSLFDRQLWNHVEGFHSRLDKHIRKHPDLYSLIDLFKTIETESGVIMKDILQGQLKAKSTIVKKNAAIINFT